MVDSSLRLYAIRCDACAARRAYEDVASRTLPLSSSAELN